MNLVLDIGNTVAKCFIFDGDEPVASMHSEGCTLEGLGRFVADHRPERGIMSAVVDLPASARRELALLPCKLQELSDRTPLPIRNCYRTPHTLGSDRLAAALGAWKLLGGQDVLVVDAGTCVTLDLLTADGRYLGGNIAPGVEMRLAAMHRHTSRLPLISPEGETPLLGCDTPTAMRSGAWQGVAREIEGTAHRLGRDYPGLRVVLTGGDGARLSELLTIDALFDEALAARGLNEVLGTRDKVGG